LPSTSPPLPPHSLFTNGQPSTSKQQIPRPPSSQADQIITEKVIDDTELQELRAKVRVLEAKRADDARHVRELETRLSEAESFVALRPKLQAKLNSQQTELIATRRELADSKQLAELNEGRVVDAQEQLEMAMLDKEVAEERAEIAESELDDLRERLAIAEVELEVMKEGEESGEGGDPNVKTSLAYIQLEKQNERLKEALIRFVVRLVHLARYTNKYYRLRDMSSENDQEQRRRIAEMEKDMSGIDDLQCMFSASVST
jgi:dynactin 1